MVCDIFRNTLTLTRSQSTIYMFADILPLCSLDIFSLDIRRSSGNKKGHNVKQVAQSKMEENAQMLQSVLFFKLAMLIFASLCTDHGPKGFRWTQKGFKWSKTLRLTTLFPFEPLLDHFGALTSLPCLAIFVPKWTIFGPSQVMNSGPKHKKGSSPRLLCVACL